MKADYDILSKLLLVVKLMRKVETRGSLLHRKLVGDIMIQLQRPGTIIGVDAASCYNWIVDSVVILFARHEGMKLLPLLALFGVIKQMKNYVRVEYSKSDFLQG